MSRLDHSEKRAYLRDGSLIFLDSDGNEQGGIMCEDGPPLSGTSGTGVGYCSKGTKLIDGTNGVEYINEGTSASPYWTPSSFNQAPLAAIFDDFRGLGAGKAIADTAATATLPSGLRVFGQGIEVNGDSGLVRGALADGSGVGGGGVDLGVLHVTNEDLHLSAIGTQERVFQPDTHKVCVIDITWTDVADILTSSVFCGFTGLAADALDPLASGATTTVTFNADDLAGLYSNAAMTDANGTFKVAEKSNLGGTQTSVTSVVDRQAAGTYQRWRLECNSSGVVRAFANKVDLGTILGPTAAATHDATNALDADEECSPVFYVENNTTTTRTANIKQFFTYFYR